MKKVIQGRVGDQRKAIDREYLDFGKGCSQVQSTRKEKNCTLNGKGKPDL